MQIFRAMASKGVFEKSIDDVWNADRENSNLLVSCLQRLSEQVQRLGFLRGKTDVALDDDKIRNRSKVFLIFNEIFNVSDVFHELYPFPLALQQRLSIAC